MNEGDRSHVSIVLESIFRKIERIENSIQGRRKIRKSVKIRHLVAMKEMGDRCPMCAKHTEEVEFDHFYANSMPDFDHVWPICPSCHSKLTTGRVPRDRASVRFHAYIDQAREVDDGTQMKLSLDTC